jgi:hypothetical protein
MDLQEIFLKNRAATERLKELVQGLSSEALTQAKPGEWPVFITLAHLAFWDQRVLHVIALAQKNKQVMAPMFDDTLNDILAPILAAIPPEAARRLALDTFVRLDATLEGLSPELIARMMKVNNRLVERHLHRNAHSNDLEALLAL